jgi:hypothetical protein
MPIEADAWESSGGVEKVDDIFIAGVVGQA